MTHAARAYSVEPVVDFDVAKRVLAAFEREGVRYVIIGAAALNFHGAGAIHAPATRRSVLVCRKPCHAIQMKRDTVRLKDKADAELLRQRFKLDEEG